MKLKLFISVIINIYNNINEKNENSLFLNYMPKVINNIILRKPVVIDSKPRLEYLNKEYFKYIKGTVNKEEIKVHEPLKYANILLRHAVIINTKYSQNTKHLYLLSRSYKNLLYKEKILLSHPAIGRKEKII